MRRIAADDVLPRVTVIIPTMALADRSAMLDRAIDSLGGCSRYPVHVLVVVNGGRFDEMTVARLRARNEVEVIQIASAGLPGALRVGREAVRTEFFSFLDDDDEYLPGAIDTRAEMLDGRPEVALAVTNGYRCIGGVDTLAARHVSQVEQDPMAALFQGNWLASCGGLFRSSIVGSEYFADVVPYLEWTWIAFSLCNASCNISALDVPTYRIHDTPGSASKSQEFERARHALVSRMLAAGPSEATRRRILQQRRDVLHCLASMDSESGDLRSAWGYHWATLMASGGWRYLPFTRHLVVASMRRIAARWCP
jgi:glycosyltransferase involved in cell wall biosynthesis